MYMTQVGRGSVGRRRVGWPGEEQWRWSAGIDRNYWLTRGRMCASWQVRGEETPGFPAKSMWCYSLSQEPPPLPRSGDAEFVELMRCPSEGVRVANGSISLEVRRCVMGAVQSGPGQESGGTHVSGTGKARAAAVQTEEGQPELLEENQDPGLWEWF